MISSLAKCFYTVLAKTKNITRHVTYIQTFLPLFGYHKKDKLIISTIDIAFFRGGGAHWEFEARFISKF